ncbi:MAG TPA: CBS domain-containing protein [Polyangiaceae bacterium]|jgi:CBS domain-containing protein|nr:CBS domain-containing protein [Polyangiaceae bacterium]
MLLGNSVSFVMTTDRLVTVDVTDRMSTACRLLSAGSIHHLPVLDGNKLVGIISTTDLLRAGIGIDADEDESPVLDVGQDELDEALDIEGVMEKRLVTLHPKDTLRRAAELFAEASFNSLPVVDEEGELIGILTMRDLLRYILAADSGRAG